MEYPTEEQVQRAPRHQLSRWFRFLPSPADDEQHRVLALVVKRHTDLGGWTPELSKSVGFDEHTEDTTR